MRFRSARLMVVGTTMAVAFAAGCASEPPKPAPKTTVLSEDNYAQIKAAYLAANPNARVGRVDAVLPASRRLSVTDIPLADFKKGDVISVVDDKLNAIADGTVVEMDASDLYVVYEPVSATSRTPASGDIAVRAETPTR
jgi:hypothetical protein